MYDQLYKTVICSWDYVEKFNTGGGTFIFWQGNVSESSRGPWPAGVARCGTITELRTLIALLITQMNMMNRTVALLLLVAVGVSQAFVSPSNAVGAPTTTPKQTNRLTTVSTSPQPLSSTALSERQWNFNGGRSLWGLKKNAEIWNGRVAQMAFVFVLLQEAISGKGVIQSLQDGDLLAYVGVGVAVVSTIGLTAWLAIKGDESDIIF